MQISFGITEVCVNPKEDEATPPKAPTVSISTEDLTLQKGANNHQGNSYVLLLRVQPPESQSDEPAPKRRRLSEQTSQAAGQESSIRLFGAELIIYDKHNRCLLVDGDYELALQQLSSNEPTSGRSSSQNGQQSASTSWNSLAGSASSPKAFLSQGPTLKFRLQWADQPVSPLVDR
jgi:polycomb protein SUZ12